MMTFDQSEKQNKAEFIARLMEAGWSKKEALAEWERVQEDGDE